MAKVLAVGGGARGSRTQQRPLMVCFSHLRWNFVYQRPQHLMSHAAQDYDVVFFEEPLIEATAAPRLDVTPVAPHIAVAVPVLPKATANAAEAQRELLDAYLAGLGSRQTLLWFYTPMALRFARHLDAAVCIYDSMDELAAFRNAPPQISALEQELFARADVVFCGGRSLFEAKRAQHANIHAFPSSIDARHFARARAALPDPEDQAAVPRPRLGFFGVIDERLDVDLLDSLAAQ